MDKPIPPSLLGLKRQEARLVTARARDVLDWSCAPFDELLTITAAGYAPAGHPARSPNRTGAGAADESK